MTEIEDLPNFQISEFGGAKGSFLFDFAPLQSNSEIPRPFLHRHSYYHILWMTHACGTHIIDFETFEIKYNSVFFLSPGQVHAWSSSVDASGFVMNFSAEFFLQMFPKMEELAEFPFFHITNSDPVLYLSPEQHEELFPLLQQIETEFNDALLGRYDVVRSFLLILLTKLRRLHKPRQTDLALPKSYSLTKRFKLLIEQRFLEFGSVQEYASMLLVTERRLNEAVKGSTGRTATQLIHDRIMLEAKRLLAQTDLGISEIAYRLNFEDPAYFCRFFKKQVSLTPGEFRRKFALPFQ
jgi:AraC family transcriptional activator of pobA